MTAPHPPTPLNVQGLTRGFGVEESLKNSQFSTTKKLQLKKKQKFYTIATIIIIYFSK